MRSLRTLAITDYLKGRKYCSVDELREHFNVSTATIYRDIAALVSKDVVRRVGGGVALEERTGQMDNRDHFASSPYMDRIDRNCEPKRAIASTALTRIMDGDIVFLDSSTTVSYLADKLLTTSFSSLTIVTNSVTAIQNFQKYPPQYVLISLGGYYDFQLNAFLGESAIRELERLSITKAFISAFGVSSAGVSTNHENHSTLLGKVLRISEQKYLLVDGSKFERNGLFRFAQKNQFDEIITD
ncbi:MAG: DeoR/GlpR transcriptional regulator [Victivallales bacterium]|nr:DeoR/GlpR transcriptional regulator [Victivallales bacterium]MBR5026048.1 DeoR/GlpR transcriptional regulator [Victivallales bacterium]